MKNWAYVCFALPHSDSWRRLRISPSTRKTTSRDSLALLWAICWSRLRRLIGGLILWNKAAPPKVLRRTSNG
jgi:hypothetical protein